VRGLLIKDIKLMKNNGKSLFLILIFVGATMGIVMKNVYMSVGYAFFIFTMFTVSTISYDEYDNGYPFLFTLPITRRQYVNEKYLFVFILVALSFGIGALVGAVQILFFESEGSYADILMIYGAYAAIMLAMNAILIPLKLKFEAEKSRFAIPIVFGGTAIVAVIAVKGFQRLPEETKAEIFTLISKVGILGGILIIAGAAIGITIVSWLSSQHILKKKEF